MKLAVFSAISFTVAGVFAHNSHVADRVAVYELSAAKPADSFTVDASIATLYLADKFGVADHYKVTDADNKDDAIDVINKLYALHHKESNPKLIVSLGGVENPEQFFDSSASLVYQDHHGKWTKAVFKEFPGFIKATDESLSAAPLTRQLQVVASHSLHGLKHHFKYFNDQLLQIWRKHTTSQDGQAVLNSADSIKTFKLINDKFFISELSQLIHLTKFEFQDARDVVFMQLHSLESIWKKTSKNSASYKFANRVLKDFLLEMSHQFDITVLVSGTHSAVQTPQLANYEKELDTIFKRGGAKTLTSASCFESEEQCTVGTDQCNSHGKCVQIQGKCWSCACQATHNKTTSRTSYWSGYDCAKKDISSTANLLLWSSLTIIVVIVGGINLLFKVGNEPLPGVLDAASSQKSS